jgi:hypothetical protein
MLNRFFPERIDNTFRGNVVAFWLFVPIVFMKVAVSLAHIFRADGGAQSVSTIPLDTYPSGAAQNIVAIFARMGLEQLLLGALLVIVLIRYRSMIPLIYLLLVMQYAALEWIIRMKPLVLAGTSGARTMALVLAALSVAGLVLSIIGKGDRNYDARWRE